MPRDIKYARIHLIGLRPNNVDEFYNKKFNRWLLFKSSKVKFNERLIENPIERFFLMLPKNENGEPQDGEVEISGTTPKGYELYEDDFIHDELIILTPLYNEIEKTTETELSKQLKQYIDFLNQRKEQIEKINTPKEKTQHLPNELNTTQQQKPHQLNTGLTDTQLNTLADGLISNGFINEADKECFIWAFGGTNDIETFTQIQWPKMKNLCVYLIDTLLFDEKLKIQQNYFSQAKKLINIKNMSQIKNGYKMSTNTGKPINHDKINDILKKAKETK